MSMHFTPAPPSLHVDLHSSSFTSQLYSDIGSSSDTSLSPTSPLAPAFDSASLYSERVQQSQGIPNYLTNGNHSASFSQINAIASAGHSTLVEVQNRAYMHLLQQNSTLHRIVEGLQVDIKVLKKERDTLRESYEILAQNVPQALSVSNPLKISVNNVSSHAGDSVPSGWPSSWPNASDFDNEQLKRLFWTKTFWKEYNDTMQGSSSLAVTSGKRGRTRASKGINVAMLYVVDINGTPVNGYTAGEMRDAARGIWRHLSNAGKAPDQWKTDVPVETSDKYKYEMAHRYKELRLCDNGWKAQQIAIDNYPSWRFNRTKAGKFNIFSAEPEPSEDEQSGNSDSDSDQSQDKGKSKHKADDRGQSKHKADDKGKGKHKADDKGKGKHKADEQPVTKKHKTDDGKPAAPLKIKNPLTGNRPVPKRTVPDPLNTTATLNASLDLDMTMKDSEVIEATSTVPEPAIVEPAVVEPAVVESAIVEPAVVEPAVVESAIVKPAVVEPAVIEPAIVEPAIVEPAIVEPAIVEPAIVEPAVVEPAVVAIVEPATVEHATAGSTTSAESAASLSTSSQTLTESKIVSKTTNTTVNTTPSTTTIELEANSTEPTNKSAVAPPPVKPLGDKSLNAPPAPKSGKKKAPAKTLAAEREVVIKPNITARNLGMLDWFNTNPEDKSQGAFKAYWDRMASEEKKKYTAMERKAKANKYTTCEAFLEAERGAGGA